MVLTNGQIYDYTRALMEEFYDDSLRLPIKMNFYLQKNKKTLFDLAQEIEKSRLEIASTYGELDEETQQYQVPADKVEAASKDLNELFNIEQDVNIYKINIDSLSDDFVLTTAQMEAIMFMIED